MSFAIFSVTVLGLVLGPLHGFFMLFWALLSSRDITGALLRSKARKKISESRVPPLLDSLSKNCSLSWENAQFSRRSAARVGASRAAGRATAAGCTALIWTRAGAEGDCRRPGRADAL